MKRYDLIYDNTVPSKYRINENISGEFVKYKDAKVLQGLLNEWLNARCVVNATHTPSFKDLIKRTLEAVKDGY
jgi:hypothetical protein